MNKTIIFSALAISALSMTAQVNLINKVAGNGATDGATFEFKTLVDLEATPVKEPRIDGHLLVLLHDGLSLSRS